MPTDPTTEYVAKCLYEAHAASAEDANGIIAPWQNISLSEQRNWQAAALKAKLILLPISDPRSTHDPEPHRN
ncbi:hypothetical protein JWJ88_03520 [Paracoccus methylovorus]|uniref:Uncharacterized protein n=1 Tax=Paracoccus methylovorus TaxID=2812658 RepID=A0ABX7JIJ2_9RHOB|nr:hypothetical protein [Paracoccus methylovorus]QRZ13746.1 hypothetical protein JWJ88_03520 [Paracoccus methylovorus]